MLTPDQVALIIATNNQSVTFDGQTYTITDVNGNISYVLSTDLLAFQGALQQEVALQAAQIVGLQVNLSQVATFIANYPVK